MNLAKISLIGVKKGNHRRSKKLSISPSSHKLQFYDVDSCDPIEMNKTLELKSYELKPTKIKMRRRGKRSNRHDDSLQSIVSSESISLEKVVSLLEVPKRSEESAMSVILARRPSERHHSLEHNPSYGEL